MPLFASPLFDFQVNGYAGVDFQDPEIGRDALEKACRALAADGVGGIFLTLITQSEARLQAQFSRLEALRAESATIAAMVCGYHLEGPWLSPEVGFCGAHPPQWMCAPSLASFTRWQEAAGGRIRLVTLAPEWPGSAGVIAGLVAQGVQVALGHTDADDRAIDAAVAAGARFCTHLGNGVPRMLPRHDNIVQRLLARDELTACFIPDGIHLPPFVLRNFVRAKPEGRVLFTTDAMSAAGAPPGTFRFAGALFSVGADGVVRDAGPSGGFAGSSLTPSRGVELTADFLGWPRERALAHWSEAPARAFGVTLPARCDAAPA